MKRFCLPFFAALLLLSSCSSKPDLANAIQGVWMVTKIVIVDDNEIVDPGNMHYVITGAHIMTIGGKEERPIINKVFADMTPEEILSQLPAGGGFMKYKIVEGKIHRTTIFALSELFEGKLIVTEVETDGETLVFRDNHHADGKLREWHMVRVE